MNKQPIHTPDAPAAVGPYGQGIRLGNLLFTSGQIPLTASGELVTGSLEEQTHQVFKNLTAVLATVGADFSHVVKATVYLSDMNNFAAMNAIYGEYLKAPYPARTCVQVARLPMDVLVEIEMIVEIPEK